MLRAFGTVCVLCVVALSACGGSTPIPLSPRAQDVLPSDVLDWELFDVHETAETVEFWYSAPVGNDDVFVSICVADGSSDATQKVCAFGDATEVAVVDVRLGANGQASTVWLSCVPVDSEECHAQVTGLATRLAEAQ